MALFIKKRAPLFASPPAHRETVQHRHARIHTFTYNEQYLEESDNVLPEENTDMVTWIDIIGSDDENLINEIGRKYHLHPLTLQDIMQPGKRPHHVNHEEYASVRMNMVTREEGEEGGYTSEHITFILMADTLLTFQQYEGDLFDGVRDRIRKGLGRVRRSGPDYLLYALSNAIFLHAVELVEHLGEEIEDNEEILIHQERDDMIQAINRGRSSINFLVSQIRPDRDTLREFMREESVHVSSSARIYLRDLYDTATQTIEALESYREMVKDQHDALSAHTASKLNDVMKFLTIFSVIFIPLSLIAGIYGTNFSTIPTLASPFGFYYFLITLVIIAIVMIIIFKLKKWL